MQSWRSRAHQRQTISEALFAATTSLFPHNIHPQTQISWLSPHQWVFLCQDPTDLRRQESLECPDAENKIRFYSALRMVEFPQMVDDDF